MSTRTRKKHIEHYKVYVKKSDSGRIYNAVRTFENGKYVYKFGIKDISSKLMFDDLIIAAKKTNLSLNMIMKVALGQRFNPKVVKIFEDLINLRDELF